MANEYKYLEKMIGQNLLFRAKRLGTIKFKTPKEEEEYIAKLKSLYIKYRKLINDRRYTYEDANRSIKIGTSREEKKYVKGIKREAKRKLKNILEQIEVIESQISNLMKPFDLYEIGGTKGAIQMMRDAYDADLIMSKKPKPKASFVAEANVDEHAALKTAHDSEITGRTVETVEKVD